MSGVSDELRSYYEEEARRQLRKPLTGPRVGLRQQFMELIRMEERTRVVDFGAGPGRDGVGFAEDGIDMVGLDLAHGNGVLAARNGVTVVQGSVVSPPFRKHSFDAGWSMSTLMHLPDDEMAEAVTAMAATLEPGAPLLVGVWGGDGDEHTDESIQGRSRRFFLRSAGVNAEILSLAGSVESSDRWDFGQSGRYQVFSVRVGH